MLSALGDAILLPTKLALFITCTIILKVISFETQAFLSTICDFLLNEISPSQFEFLHLIEKTKLMFDLKEDLICLRLF